MQFTRKTLRLKGHDYRKTGYYFLTLCTKDGQYLFADEVVREGIPKIELNQCGKMVEDHIRRVELLYAHVRLDCFVMMPNHVHMIVGIYGTNEDGIGDKAISIPQIVLSLKTVTSKKFGTSLWQRSYYEHVIRNRESLNEIREHIRTNPQKWKKDRFYHFV